MTLRVSPFTTISNVVATAGKLSCDVDHDIRAVVMYEIVKHPSQGNLGRGALTGWNLAFEV